MNLSCARVCVRNNVIFIIICYSSLMNVVETDAEEEEEGVKPLIDSKFSCNVYEATHTLHHGIAPHDNNNHTGL